MRGPLAPLALLAFFALFALTGCPRGEPAAPVAATTGSPATTPEDSYARHLAAVNAHLAAWRPADALASATAAVAAFDRPEARAARDLAQRCVDAQALGSPEASVAALLGLEPAPWRAAAIAVVASTSDALQGPNALALDRSIDGAHEALVGPPAAGRAAPAEQIALRQTLDRAHRLFVTIVLGEADPARLERAEKDLTWVETRGFRGRVSPEIEQKLEAQVVHVRLARLLALLARGKRADAASGEAAFRAAHEGVAGAALDAIAREAAR